MPRVVEATTLIKELGGPKIWSCVPQNKNLMSKLGTFSAKVNRKSVLEQHVRSYRHKNNVKLYYEGEKATQMILSLNPGSSSNGSDSIFNSDLVKALVSADIRLYKIKQQEFRAFLEMNTKKTTPCTKTLTMTLEKEGKYMLYKIEEKLVGKSLFLSMDDTTDSLGRPMCIVLAGPLDGDFLERPYLIDMANLGTTNNLTVEECINSALFKVFGVDLNYEMVRLFLTDGASCCVKASKGLKELYPNIIHCLCVAHGLNRVAEMVRCSWSPKVD